MRPSRGDVMDACADAFANIPPRPDERRRLFDERSTIGLMLGQVLSRNAPCKDVVRRMQIEFGVKASSSTAAYCRGAKGHT